ncbi:MAG: fibronectin type III domain-containing protein [bacterium]
MRSLRIVTAALAPFALALAMAPAQPALAAAAPGVPVGLRAIPLENAVDPTKPLMQLRWQPPADGGAPTAYRVYVDYELVETTIRCTINPRRPLCRANVMDLVPGQVYAFEVAAVNEAGAGKVASARREAVMLPSEPLDVRVVPDNARLYVSWDAPLDTGGGAIRSYFVRVNSPIPGPPPQCVSTGATSCTVSGLINAYAYDVTVEARNSGYPFLQGPESVPAVGIPGGRPSGPRNVRLVSAGSSSATIAWDAPQFPGPEPILGYTLFLHEGQGFQPAYPQVTVGASVRQYRLTGLTAGLTYTFAVQAYTASFAGGMTVHSQHTPLGIPRAPERVDITGTGNTTVQLAWEDASPSGGLEATHYRLTATPVAPVPAGVMAQELVCPVKASQDAPDFECAGTYLWMNLVNGVRYSFTVAAKNKFGWGPTSTYPASAMPEGTPPPPLLSSTIDSPTQITLTWEPSVTAGGPDVGDVTYTVTLNDDPVCRDISATTCVLPGLTPGQDYDAKVMAVNEVFGGDALSTSALIVNTQPIQVAKRDGGR